MESVRENIAQGLAQEGIGGGARGGAVVFGFTLARLLAMFAVIAGLTVSAQTVPRAQGVARIRGEAVHPDGTPDAFGSVEIEPVNSTNPPAVAATAADGSFETDPLPPGKYRIGVDIGINRQPDEAYGRFYYPGTPKPSDATEIEIASYLPEPRISFVLPPKRPLVEMRGRVLLEDGTPAVRADVYFSPVGGYSTAQMWTDGQGAFKASKYGSVAYKIHSSTGDGKYRSEEMIIQASELEKPIAITLHPIQAQNPQHDPR